jgi:hypothetical protein
MVFLQFSSRGWIAAPDRAEQIFRLVPEMIEIGPDGQVTIGHDEPPRECPASAGSGERRFA